MRHAALAALLALTVPAWAAPPEGKKKVKERVDVAVAVGNGKVVEDPKPAVASLPFRMDMKGNVSSGSALFGRLDFEDFVARSLKDRDFMRIEIELDFPDETPAPLVLKVIDQVKRGVKDGKRVELTFTYTIEVEKG